MKTIHLEGAMLDEVDVWFPNIPVVVKGVQCGVPGIQKYSPMYPNVSQCIPIYPNVSPIYPKGAGSFHIHRKIMKELGALAVLGIQEQPNLAQNLVTHRH